MSYFLKKKNYHLLICSLFIVASFFFIKPVQAAACGNGVCQISQGETCQTCPVDCGVCPAPTTTPTSTPAPTSTPQPTPTRTPTPPPPTPVPTSIPNATPTPTSVPGITPTPTSSQPTPTLAPGEPTTVPAPGEPTPTSSATAPSEGTPSSPSGVYEPSVSLGSYTPDPTNKTTLRYSGSTSVEQGTVTLVEYTLTDGATWFPAQLSQSTFTFTTPRLPEGQHIIKVRAKSSAGVYTKEESYASDTVTVVTTPPTVVMDAITPNPTTIQILTITVQATSSLSTISGVEVSFDNGSSWLPTKLVGKKYSILSAKLEDGNYSIIARAVDAAGNIGRSVRQIVVVDTIPPLIGGSQINIGPQVLTPHTDGTMDAVAGGEVTISMSMKGGVTEALLLAGSELFPLHHLKGTNLWTGNLRFNEVGTHSLKVIAYDGAENRTERVLGTLIVKDYGTISSAQSGHRVKDAVVSLYFFDTVSRRWALWEAQPYGQENPQITTDNGRYGFLVPEGRYYLDIQAAGHRAMQSEILQLTSTTIINVQAQMQLIPHLSADVPGLGITTLQLPSIPTTLSKTEFINTESVTNKTMPQLNQIAPDFSFEDRQNKSVTLDQFKGKKLLLTYLAPWSPQSLEQSAALSKASTILPQDQAMMSVFLQESSATTDIFMKKGSYSFFAVADKNGISTEQYHITFLPQHFFIGSDGKIKDIYVGNLDSESLVERLRQLP